MSGPTAGTPAPAGGEPSRARWWQRGLDWLAVGVLAAAFLPASVAKIVHPQEFADHLALHSTLPLVLVPVVVAFLPWLELTCGLCLVLRVAVREAALLLSILLVLFIAYALRQRTELECGCGILPRRLDSLDRWPWVALRDLVLLCCSLCLAWPSHGRFRLPFGARGRRNTSGAAPDTHPGGRVPEGIGARKERVEQ